MRKSSPFKTGMSSTPTSPHTRGLHLKKSGAGTAYYEAVDPDRRDALEARFVKKLIERKGGREGYEVIHNYITCIARKK